MSSFETWWFREGSGMPPQPNEDRETHMRRVSEIAWSNGQYSAEQALLDALKAAHDHLLMTDKTHTLTFRRVKGVLDKWEKPV